MGTINDQEPIGWVILMEVIWPSRSIDIMNMIKAFANWSCWNRLNNYFNWQYKITLKGNISHIYLYIQYLYIYILHMCNLIYFRFKVQRCIKWNIFLESHQFIKDYIYINPLFRSVYITSGFSWHFQSNSRFKWKQNKWNYE